METSYGTTLVRSCGREDAPALVLLPSGFASSLVWLPTIGGLAPHFSIHAVDNIYDVGRSVNTCPVRNADDLSEWLDELFTQLGLGDSINLMGLSLGGWLAGQYALRHQERLHSLIMAAPAATILPLPAEWAWRGIIGALPPHRFFMTHFLTNWMCPDLVKKGDEQSRALLGAWMDDALVAMKCFAFRMPIAPTVMSDEELGSLEVPTLFLVGENEVICPAHEAVRRIESVAPSIVARVVRHAGHDLIFSRTDAVNREVVSFVEGGAPKRLGAARGRGALDMDRSWPAGAVGIRNVTLAKSHPMPCRWKWRTCEASSL